MNDDQVLALTREIADIGATQRQMMELLREVKQEQMAVRQELSNNYMTKAEHQATKDAFKREIELLQGALNERKEAPYKVWTVIFGAAAAVPGIIALILGK